MALVNHPLKSPRNGEVSRERGPGPRGNGGSRLLQNPLGLLAQR